MSTSRLPVPDRPRPLPEPRTARSATVRYSTLLAGFAAAVGLRVAVGGPSVATSTAAGWTFAAALVILALAGRAGLRLTVPAIIAGTVAAGVLLAPVLVRRLLLVPAGHRPAGGFLAWAAVVAVVAMAEEAFLRGALFDALSDRHGSVAALIVTSACFAALHIPLYGWPSIVLNTAVGLCLGVLRLWTGTWTAPAIAHIGADLAAWWLR